MTAGFTSTNSGSLCVTTIRTRKFDDRVIRISGAEFCHSVAHVYLQTSNLVSFTVEIATKFLNLMSKTND